MRTSQVSKLGVGAAATPLVTTAETVVATVGGVSTQSPDSLVILEAVVQVLYGTGTTGATIRVRRGTDATGAVVGTAVLENATAGVTGDLELQVQDAPGELAGGSYVVTVQQAGASGNGTFQQGSLQVSY